MNKVKKLKQHFKKEADKKNKTGNGRGKPWKFFTQLDEINAADPMYTTLNFLPVPCRFL